MPSPLNPPRSAEIWVNGGRPRRRPQCRLGGRALYQPAAAKLCLCFCISLTIVPAPASRLEGGLGGTTSERGPLLQPTWTKGGSSTKGSKTVASYVVMQFNVLADGPAQGQFSRFKGARNSSLSFPERFDRSLRVIRQVNPDVIFLQELNHYHDFWSKKLASHYIGVFMPKYDASYPDDFKAPPDFFAGQPTDGCALFVKKGRLRILKHKTVRFGDATGKVMAQVAVAALIGDWYSRRPVFIGSTSHLKAGGAPNDHKTRQAQVHAWAKFLTQFGNEPLVLAGDMNEDYNKYPKGSVAALCKTLKLVSAYKDEGDPPFTMMDSKFRALYDYILISKTIQANRILKTPELQDDQIPGFGWPSDHLALAAELRFPVLSGSRSESKKASSLNK